ncbi:MAG: hypothetical protein JNL32_10085 [Candidatus Kapabacteria bacterium]|nr:hypothetical protein [Candidatus Kapabacteria bacterium]
MARRSVILLILHIAFFTAAIPLQSDAQPDTILNKRGLLVLQPFAEYNSSAIYYDSTGKTITRIERPNEQFGYVTDLSVYTVGVAARYNASDVLTLHARLPFSIATLNENYSASLIGIIKPRRNLSATGMQYYQVGMEYLLPSKKSRTSALLNIRTAPSFTSPEANADSNSFTPFMPGGTVMVSAGLQSNIKFSNTDVIGRFEYHYRSGDLRDLASISLEGRIYSIGDAIIRCGAQGVFTTGATRGVRGFNTQTFPLYESYISAGAGFMMFLSDELYFDVNYTIRVVGTNTWGLGTINTTVGFALPVAEHNTTN